MLKHAWMLICEGVPDAWSSAPLCCSTLALHDAEDVPKMNPLGKLLRLIGGSSPASTQAAARRRRRRRRRIPPDIATAPATAI
uniref:Uncharacterized protein n=1 Tax=Oryza rufipogon TaxID=4529 RepID=A0A0E0PAF5_ORYRU